MWPATAPVAALYSRALTVHLAWRMTAFTVACLLVRGRGRAAGITGWSPAWSGWRCCPPPRGPWWPRSSSRASAYTSSSPSRTADWRDAAHRSVRCCATPRTQVSRAMCEPGPLRGLLRLHDQPQRLGGELERRARRRNAATRLRISPKVKGNWTWSPSGTADSPWADGQVPPQGHPFGSADGAVRQVMHSPADHGVRPGGRPPRGILSVTGAAKRAASGTPRAMRIAATSTGPGPMSAVTASATSRSGAFVTHR